RRDWVKRGATVIDIGVNREMAGRRSRIVGDVAFGEVAEIAGAMTPVPGGVGPVTMAGLLAATVRAACAPAGLPEPGCRRGGLAGAGLWTAPYRRSGVGTRALSSSKRRRPCPRCARRSVRTSGPPLCRRAPGRNLPPARYPRAPIQQGFAARSAPGHAAPRK